MASDLAYVRMPVWKRGCTTKLLHSFHGYRLIRQTAENDWDHQGRRNVVNISRLKPYADREISPTSPDEKVWPMPTVHIQSAQQQGREHQGPQEDDSDNEEFFDALSTPPDDAVRSPLRPRHSIVPH